MWSELIGLLHLVMSLTALTKQDQQFQVPKSLKTCMEISLITYQHYCIYNIHTYLSIFK